MKILSLDKEFKYEDVFTWCNASCRSVCRCCCCYRLINGRRAVRSADAAATIDESMEGQEKERRIDLLLTCCWVRVEQMGLSNFVRLVFFFFFLVKEPNGWLLLAWLGLARPVCPALW